MELMNCKAYDCCNFFYPVPRARGGGRKKEFCQPTCYRRQRNRNFRFNQPEEYKAKYLKSNMSRYGLTQEKYDFILEQQGGGCAVCKTDSPGGRGRFHIDHDHDCCPGTGGCCGECIRGLLCHKCNIAAGHLYSDPVRILALLEYIEKSKR